MLDLIDIIRFPILIVLVIIVNVFWYEIKNILLVNGYKVSWFSGHFGNLLDFSNLIDNTYDQNEKNRYKLIFRGLIVTILIFIATVVTFAFDFRNISCNRYNNYLNEEISGVIVDKFNDQPNHNYQTLTIESNGEQINNTVLSIHNNGLFDSVNVGDKIAKRRGDSITIIIHPDNSIVEFKVDKRNYCND